jgi:hypothetical protein
MDAGERFVKASLGGLSSDHALIGALVVAFALFGGSVLLGFVGMYGLHEGPVSRDCVARQ